MRQEYFSTARSSLHLTPGHIVLDIYIILHSLMQTLQVAWQVSGHKVSASNKQSSQVSGPGDFCHSVDLEGSTEEHSLSSKAHGANKKGQTMQKKRTWVRATGANNSKYFKRRKTE